MPKKFNGVLQYGTIFVVVFIFALLFFIFVLSAIFPSNALAEGPVSPYYGESRTAQPSGESGSDSSPSEEISIGGETYEFSKLISVYEKLSANEKLTLYGLFASKFTNDEIAELYEMTADGVSDDERSYLNSLAQERLTSDDLSELYALYRKYAD